MVNPALSRKTTKHLDKLVASCVPSEFGEVLFLLIREFEANNATGVEAAEEAIRRVLGE